MNPMFLIKFAVCVFYLLYLIILIGVGMELYAETPPADRWSITSAVWIMALAPVAVAGVSSLLLWAAKKKKSPLESSGHQPSRVLPHLQPDRHGRRR
jgi:hypothetical protein